MSHICNVKPDVVSSITDMEQLVNRYFNLMAQNFPIICASDEFYFFPRVQNSLSFMTVVDDLDKHKLQDNINCVKVFLQELDKWERMHFPTESHKAQLDLEGKIDLELIKNSMLSFLREFDDIKIWQRDPTFYLKIVLLGIDSAMSKPYSTKDELVDRLLQRLMGIPRLLEQAAKNLENVPQLFVEVAHEIKSDCIDFFNFSVTQFIHNNCDGNEELSQANNNVMQHLDKFNVVLDTCSNDDNFSIGQEHLCQILRESYGYEKAVDELEEISKEGYRQTLLELEKIKKKIDSQKSWQEIYKGFKIELLSQRDLLNLYRSEVQDIKTFFEEQGLVGSFNCSHLEVKETPVYMRALRASASYCAPISNDIKEEAIFYISPSKEVLMARGKGPYVIDDIHREYIFTTAHEAYPGHHLLDTIRRQLNNVVRKQLENPLYYEGWACYSEFLLKDGNYIKKPIQILISLKRDLWRYARSILDIGIQTNEFGCEEGAKKLMELGFNPSEAMKQVKRYAMMPSYQLSYAIGRHEILDLRTRYAPRIGLRDFHNTFLEGGQIPFKWVEKRMNTETVIA